MTYGLVTWLHLKNDYSSFETTLRWWIYINAYDFYGYKWLYKWTTNAISTHNPTISVQLLSHRLSFAKSYLHRYHDSGEFVSSNVLYVWPIR